MSLRGGESQPVDDDLSAASHAGIIFVLAADNGSSDTNNSSTARVNGTNIFTISAMDIIDNFTPFSNVGNSPVNYCAPGVCIELTWRGGGYNTISGNSMAAPHSSGVNLLSGAGTDKPFICSDHDGNPDPIISVN
jgi:subtilisin family serine protease